MKKQNWWVYILKCKDGSFYTGSTTNIERRLKEHQSGKGAKYTRSRLPVKFHLAFGPYPNRSMAQKMEHSVKKQSHKWKVYMGKGWE